ncbi:GNAT family N-acetyltransferase [Streptomyces odonnellii]|uniref:GNAT family N-acetyltransferase n=1 Tax=Streptomyces odonnellii TaxID=1417980 RepID=UPI0007C7BF10|nr:GNAT family protein [Streptomyces odonnellii]
MLPIPGPCGHHRHTIRTERLLLYTPDDLMDLAAVAAAGSDPQAQRWLGFTSRDVVAEPRVRQALIEMRPGDNHTVLSSLPGYTAEPYEPLRQKDFVLLVAVRLDDGRYAGCVKLAVDEGTIGGWLAPHSRAQGLGAELFGAGALLAHAHLGLDRVRAGTEVGNTASRRALLRAGFIPDEGPDRHTLPDGREIDVRWLQHLTGPVSLCRGAGPEKRQTPAVTFAHLTDSESH